MITEGFRIAPGSRGPFAFLVSSLRALSLYVEPRHIPRADGFLFGYNDTEQRDIMKYLLVPILIGCSSLGPTKEVCISQSAPFPLGVNSEQVSFNLGSDGISSLELVPNDSSFTINSTNQYSLNLSVRNTDLINEANGVVDFSESNMAYALKDGVLNGTVSLSGYPSSDPISVDFNLCFNVKDL